jgi:4-hydroxymandelate oxidase
MVRIWPETLHEAPGEQQFDDCHTLDDLAALARRRLPADVWDFVAGGAGTEATVRVNRAGLDELRLAPRCLRTPAATDLSTSFAGIELASPVMLAPVGSIGLLDSGGAATCARAAARVGAGAWIGVLSVPALEEVAAAGDAPLALQLSARNSRSVARELARRAADVGYQAVCVTADSAAEGWRDRERRHALRRRAELPQPNLGPDGLGDGPPMSWDDIAWLREAIELPLVLKGVTHVADARRAADLGLHGLIVSNHGGRQLDCQDAAVRSLARIADAVAGRIDLAVDGGIVRGTDVAKALALGARAVLVGRLMCWGLGAGGEDGLVRALEHVHGELRVTLTQLGVAAAGDLSREQLVGH